MNTVQFVGAIIVALGGLSGFAAAFRSLAQNRLDDASSRKTAAEADAIAVETARDLIQQVREEMNNRVGALDREVARLQGMLDGALAQRDRFRQEAENLHRENRELKDRLSRVEERLADVTAALQRERKRRAVLEAERDAAAN